MKGILTGKFNPNTTFSEGDVHHSIGLSFKEGRLAVLDYAYREIADELFVSLNIVRFHMKNIYTKLGVNKKTQAIAKAKELNLIQPHIPKLHLFSIQTYLTMWDFCFLTTYTQIILSLDKNRQKAWVSQSHDHL